MAIEVLTHSKRRDFKNCNRYFLHKHIHHLTPRKQKRGRRRGRIFGDVIFDVLQAKIANGEHSEWTAANSRYIINESVPAAYDEIRETGLLDATELAELDVEEVKVAEVAAAYTEKYGVDQRREIEFDIPLRNPRTNRTSRAFRLGGKIDGTVITGEKQAVIIEDKFVQQIQRVMIERLELDDQASEYVDAFLGQGWTAKVWYRHTRYPSINPLPRKEFKTKDDYPGESLDEFAERLRQDLIDRPEFYFDQQVLDFPVNHLDDYRRGRWGTAQMILHARRFIETDLENEMFPMNPSRCWEYGGCEFIPLCCKYEEAENLYVVQEDNPELSGGVTREYGTEES